MLTLDGHDKAFAGVIRVGDGTFIAVYDQHEIVSTLIMQGMTRDEAEEYFRVNIETPQADGWPMFFIGMGFKEACRTIMRAVEE